VDPIALLRKEALTVRRNLGLFLVLLVVVPMGLAVGTAVYQQTIPEDISVAVAPADETTAEEDLRLVRGGVQFFATPVAYEDRAAVERALRREEVYVGFLVPPNMTEEGANATITVLTDRTNAPLADPAELALGILETQFDRGMPASVTFDHVKLGEERTLSEFLLPSVLYGLVVLYALVYLPYHVREERRVMDRLRTETRVELVVASKLCFYGILIVVPAATITAAARYFGYGFTALAPATLLVLFLTFLFLASTGLAVVYALRLRQAAIFVNIGLTVGVLSLSGVMYPLGFYSEIRKVIARSLPPHYALVTIRSTMLRDAPLALYGDYLRWLGVATLLAVAALTLAIRHYERGGVSD
jgi:ABC-2 type transport system permease protein